MLKMSQILTYIIVDDDAFNNLLCKIVVEKTLGRVNIETFIVPEQALDFIVDKYENILLPTVLFLDINMPTMTGWEFMEKFEKLDDAIKQQIIIYILSSSVDERDKDKANNNKYIKGFLSKPLQENTILSIAGA